MISILNFKKKLKIVFIFLFIIMLPEPILAKKNIKNQVNIYFFHSDTCAHCKQEQKYLDNIKKYYSNIKIYQYEIHDPKNNGLMKEVQKIYNVKTSGVPLTIIGDTSYIGYSREKSNSIFTKTIIYYTQYNYQDKVGGLILDKNITNNIIDNTQPTLEQFIDSYGNYKLIGDLYTNNLEPEITSLILGVISQFTPIKVITAITILIIFCISKEQKEKIKYIILYLIITTLISISNLLSNNINLIIYILMLLCFLYYIYYNSKKYKKINYKQRMIMMITTLPLVTHYIEKILGIKHITIFKEILKLNALKVIDKISYYGNYILSTITINVILFILFYYISNKIRKFEIKIKSRSHLKY